MIRFSSVIFDMDGVLLDSEPLHYAALQTVLAREGHEWTHADNERLLGTTVVDSFRIIAETVDLHSPIEAYIPLYDDEVLRELQQPLTPAAGVLSLLHRLQALCVPLAVASSSLRSWISATLDSLEIAASFDVVVSGEDVDRGKPAPDIYLEAARQMGVDPDDCLAVEDAPNGIVSAHRAGMKVIAVRTPYTEHIPLGPADVTISSLYDLEVGTDENGNGWWAQRKR
jgi:HAD superfamily hydrolase (TIGR01509 family)